MKKAAMVVCGGQSKRMGSSKAWLPFGDELLLPRVVRILGQTVERVVVVAARDQDLPALPSDVAVVRDTEQGRGPLEGMSVGLAALAGHADAVFLSSCDVPFLNQAFVSRMFDLLEDYMICVPKVGGFHHPLAAVYRLEVAQVVSRLLAEDRLRPFFLFQEVSTRVVGEDKLRDADPTLASLRNLNTREDYEAALKEIRT